MSLTPPDGLPRIVWVRLPRDTRALEAQLSRALDLYKHEDLLNWQKLNNFFYITTALIAVCGLTISVNGKVWTVIVSATAGLGLVVSIAFLVTLRAGTHYLQARKQSITQFEQVLFAHPAKIQPSPESDRKRDRVLLRSPSILVLQAIPLVGLLGWAVLLVYALARGA